MKASAEAIGMAQMALGFGREVEVQVLVDSSAALAVTHRTGNGKLRHVRIGQMWIQQLAEEDGIAFRKVKGITTPQISGRSI